MEPACASITGGMVALELATMKLIKDGRLERLPLNGNVAAVSAGIVAGEALLDLDYPEDSSAEVDANVVLTGDGGLVEVQATAERTPLSRVQLDRLLSLAESGIGALREVAARRRRSRLLNRTGQQSVDLILATRNAHKLREVSRMLAPFHLSVRALPEHVVLPPEVGDTFAANALPKAATAAAALGVAVIADDSGIESEALGGRPGVRSARFAGEHATDAENLRKLLDEAPAGSALRLPLRAGVSSGPTVISSCSSANARGVWRSLRAAAGDSVTTRSFSPTTAPRA